MVADMWGGVWIVLFRMSYSHWVFVVMHVPYCQKFTECDELVAALGRKLHAMYRTTADDEGPPAQPPTDGVAHTLCAAVTAPLLQSLAPTSGGAGVTPVAGTTAAPLTPASMKHGATDGAAATARHSDAGRVGVRRRDRGCGAGVQFCSAGGRLVVGCECRDHGRGLCGRGAHCYTYCRCCE